MSLASDWAASRTANESQRPAALKTLKTAEDLEATAAVDDRGRMTVTVGQAVLRMRGEHAIMLADWIYLNFGEGSP